MENIKLAMENIKKQKSNGALIAFIGIMNSSLEMDCVHRSKHLMPNHIVGSGGLSSPN